MRGMARQRFEISRRTAEGDRTAAKRPAWGSLAASGPDISGTRMAEKGRSSNNKEFENEPNLVLYAKPLFVRSCRLFREARCLSNEAIAAQFPRGGDKGSAQEWIRE
jgi:hypothetical protein